MTAEVPSELSKHPFFRALPAALAESMARRCHLLQIPAGRAVVRSARSNHPVVMVLQGRCKGVHVDRDGHGLVTNVYYAPSILADAEAMAQVPTLETVTAIDACVVVHVSTKLFRRWVNTCPEISALMAHDLAQRYCARSDSLRSIARGHIDARLAALLHAYVDESRGVSGTFRFSQAISQEDMADQVGVSRTALTPTLNRFKRRKLLDKNNARYVLPNLQALEARSERIVSLAHRIAPPRRMRRSRLEERVRLCWPIPVVDPAQTPFYVADDHGAFKQHKVRVEYCFGRAEFSNPIQTVIDGAAEFGVVGGPDSVLVARAKGAPIKAVAMLHHNANFVCLAARKDSGICRFEHLQGKHIGFYYGHISTDILRSVLKQQNIEHTEVDVGFDYAPLMSGEVDAQWTFRVLAEIDFSAMGFQFHLLNPSSLGVYSHGYTIFAHEEFVARHGSVVQRFLQGLRAGIDFTLGQPETALRSLLQRDPTLSADLSLQKLQLYNHVTQYCTVASGDFNRSLLQPAGERLIAHGLIRAGFDVGDCLSG